MSWQLMPVSKRCQMVRAGCRNSRMLESKYIAPNDTGESNFTKEGMDSERRVYNNS